MGERIHDDEPDTGSAVVRALLAAECPQWATRPIEYLQTSGTDNAMWRVRLDSAPDVVVRLPRRANAAAGVDQEIAVLQRIERSPIASIVKTPVVRHVGEPGEGYPHRWSVLEWIDGSDAWIARGELDAGPADGLARDLGRVVEALGDIADVDVRPRPPGSRGGPLQPLLDRLDGWLDDPTWNAAGLLDVAAVKRCAAEANEVIGESVTEGFVHGDLIPGNLLVGHRRLTAVLDWGGAGLGDTAQDLAPAWSVLTGADREIFRQITRADAAAWIRGRTFELEHAVGGVLYYAPRRHPLGDVMSRTLDRILADA
ncbi:MAG: phosphotransferase [Actinomycetota bacterium]